MALFSSHFKKEKKVLDKIINTLTLTLRERDREKGAALNQEFSLLTSVDYFSFLLQTVRVCVNCNSTASQIDHKHPHNQHTLTKQTTTNTHLIDNYSFFAFFHPHLSLPNLKSWASLSRIFTAQIKSCALLTPFLLGKHRMFSLN